MSKRNLFCFSFLWPEELRHSALPSTSSPDHSVLQPPRKDYIELFQGAVPCIPPAVTPERRLATGSESSQLFGENLPQRDNFLLPFLLGDRSSLEFKRSVSLG